jgi:RNA polymerase sigma factor (sigma-70 family)
MAQPSKPTDGELLTAFLADNGQAAFAELVDRYGSMVHGVCLRVLTDHHEAQDVAQAVFLALARKASTMRGAESVGGWLHKVAWRLAINTQQSRIRRQRREENAMRDQPTMSEDQPDAGLFRAELDAAVNQLPDRYRLPLVLFHLLGCSLDETSRQLRLNSSTLRTRLARAREMLRKKLIRRGATVGSIGALTTLLSAEAGAAVLPATFVSATVQAASLAATGQLAAGVGTGVVSAEVAALTKGAINMLFWNSVKTAAVAVAAVVVAGSGMVVAQQVERTRTSERALAVAGQSVAETVEPSDAVVLQMRGDVEELIRRSDHVVVCETLAADHEKQTATVTVVRALKGDATGSLAVSWNPKRVKSESSHPGLLPESGRIAVAALSRAKSSSVSQTNAVYELVLDTLLANRLASPTDAPVALFDTYCRLVNLGDPATPAVAAKRLDLLRTQIQGDRWTYRWAAMRIARHQVPTADRRDFVPLLLRTLQDRISKVLVETMWVCADWKVTEATEPILAILNAQKRADAEVVETGLRMVGQLNSDKAFETLVRFAGDDNATLRESAVFGLLFGRDRKKVDPLLKAMRDTDGRVRARACEAFGNVREKRLVPVLIEALADPECNQQAIRILKSWTGQDLGFNPFDPLNFGPQVAKWRKWWSENEATFEFNDATVTPAAQR